MDGHDDKDWLEYRRLVLSEIERLDGAARRCREELNSVRTSIAVLQTKAGIWGLIGGSIPVIVAVLLKYL